MIGARLLARLTIRIGGGALAAEMRSGARVTWRGEAAFASPDELRDALAQLAGEPGIARTGRWARRVVVELDRPIVQLRRVGDLPPVRGATLAALVAAQPARFFRKNGQPLVTDARWLSRRRAATREAELAAVELPWLDAIFAGARGAGLVVGRVQTAGGRLRFLPADERLRRELAARRDVRRLAVLALLLWSGVGVAYAAGLLRERRDLRREIATLEQPASAVASVRARLGEMGRAVAVLDSVERRRGAYTSALGALAAALPDSAYFASVAFTGARSGIATGAGKRAAEVVAWLERSRAVEAPRLEGPVVTEVIDGREWERFTVRFGAERRR